jgi:hypothetical protein
MQTQTQTQETDPNIDFYSDEQARFEQLRALDYETFKDDLIKLRNSHPGLEREDTFVDKQNQNTGGHLYPRAEDKDELLKYTLELAQQAEDVQTAALILGIGVVYTHPFYDGNGRTSRTLYAALSRGIKPGSDEYKELMTNKNKRIHFEWMEYQLNDIPVNLIYEEKELERVAGLAWDGSLDPDAAKYHYGEREYHGLDAQESKKLDSLLGAKYGKDGDDNVGRYGANREAIMYGFSMIAKEKGISLPTFSKGEEPHPRTFISVPDILAGLDGDTKRLLTTYIQDYNTLHAKAVIDLLALHGNARVAIGGGATMSLNSLIVERSGTYLASKIGKVAK